MPAAMPQYLWFMVAGAFAAVGFGFGTGANDVANAFATSVGAKTLTLAQAVVLAIVFEFTGALVLGRTTTDVIAGKIANIKDFTGSPEVYAYGMIIALSVGFFWQWWASSKGLNVSATHSIIAGIMGFSLVWGGGKAVNWASPAPGQIPPFSGVVPIVVSWFASPIVTGCISAMLFLLLRTLVLRRNNALIKSLFVLPFAVALTLFINVYFVFTKGAKKMLVSSAKDWSDGKAAWIAAAIAGIAGLLTALIVVPLLHRRIKTFFDADGNAIEGRETKRGNVNNKGKDNDLEGKGAFAGDSNAVGTTNAADVLERISQMPGSALELAWHKRAWKKVVDLSTTGVKYDIHEHGVKEDPMVAAIHANAENFPSEVEFAFGYLQVFSAIAVIFAHGSNEVGYMAGPLTTVWEVYQRGLLPSKVQSPVWIVAISAFGLVLGLGTYGYHVIRSMGVALAKLSPTRGFCAELATSLTIMITTQMGLPTSSSQCVIGAIMGVGLCEGARKGVNWKLFGQQFASWVVTMVICAGTTAALFAAGIYTPSRIDGSQLAQMKAGVASMAGSAVKGMNSTLVSFQPAAAAGAIPSLSATQWSEFNASLAKIGSGIKDLTNAKKPQSVAQDPKKVLGLLKSVMGLQGNNSINTIGQTTVVPGANLCNGPLLASIQAGELASCPMPVW